MTATESQRQAWDAAAERAGCTSTAQWIRPILDAAAGPGRMALAVDVAELPSFILSYLYDAVPEEQQHGVFRAMRAKTGENSKGGETEEASQ